MSRCLNIVIPMAGSGERFRLAGYPSPKPFLPVHGTPLIQLVIRNLRPSFPHRYLFLVRDEHLKDPNLSEAIGDLQSQGRIIRVEGNTQGAACTVLLAESEIDSSDPLLIANSDQWLDCGIDSAVRRVWDSRVDGVILTMPASDPKWSYVRTEKGLAIEVREKEVISNEATVGVYLFKSGRDFVRSAHCMIQHDDRTLNEFYVAPVYNYLIHEGKQIVTHPVGHAMHGLGIPEDYETFLRHPASYRAVSGGNIQK